MKVLLVNGSPHHKGCTYTALTEVADTLNKLGIETEHFWIGNKRISGCIGCGRCVEIGECAIDDVVNKFLEKAKEVDADLICMSTLMTTTMGGMQTVIEKLKDQGIRDKFKVMVGGSPISKKFADDIGAEGYSVNAVEAVKVAKELTGIA